MMPVLFDPTQLKDPIQVDWWNHWLKRADDATIIVIDSFESWLSGDRKTPFRFKFNSDIWKDLKDWLMRHVFYKKCAYCERLISGYYGDAEHFRPKGAVKRKSAIGGFVEPLCEIIYPASGVALTLGHPGYFWLAYDWRNLVPSCVYCNSGQGKNERFDIEQQYVVVLKLDSADVDKMTVYTRPRASKAWPGFYYMAPAVLDEREQPLLLNPLNPSKDRNPREHIRFGVRGLVTPLKKSPFGLANIEVFRLRDEDLRQERQTAQENFRFKFYDATAREFDPENPSQSKAQTILDEYIGGKYPFSAAALDYYELLHKALPPPPARFG